MDIILQKFAGKIDAQSLIKTVEELKSEYIDDGLTKEDVPPILGRLMMESQKFKQNPQWFCANDGCYSEWICFIFRRKR